MPDISWYPHFGKDKGGEEGITQEYAGNILNKRVFNLHCILPQIAEKVGMRATKYYS